LEIKGICSFHLDFSEGLYQEERYSAVEVKVEQWIVIEVSLEDGLAAEQTYLKLVARHGQQAPYSAVTYRHRDFHRAREDMSDAPNSSRADAGTDRLCSNDTVA
jgi:hypothetical protein